MGQEQSTPAPPSALTQNTAAHTPHALHPLPPNTDPSDASACPVDHKSREAWLKLAQNQQPQTQQAADTPPPLAPHPLPPGADASSASACPVDHKAREAWLKASQRQPVTNGEETAAPAGPVRPRLTNQRLSTQREISTIPRGFNTPTPSSNSAEKAASPSLPTSPSAPPPSSPYASAQPSTSAAHGTAAAANSESAPGTDIHTSPTGHWVYPSEAMFFSAMQRKSYSPVASDMSSIIPIHNAVNERTWHEILRWERGRGAAACGGPKLVSFEGDASKLSPRAWWLSSVWGYQRPFDRHDWVVDRCGKRVDYIIDFYEGKGNGAGEREGRQAGPGPSFYLDVRPKLNSVEGVKMRVQKFWGWD